MDHSGRMKSASAPQVKQTNSRFPPSVFIRRCGKARWVSATPELGAGPAVARIVLNFGLVGSFMHMESRFDPPPFNHSARRIVENRTEDRRHMAGLLCQIFPALAFPVAFSVGALHTRSDGPICAHHSYLDETRGYVKPPGNAPLTLMRRA